MERYISFVRTLSKFANVIAGISICFMIGLTVLDVVLRGFRKPVPGTYELVAFSGALVIGLALPYTSLGKGHVLVDFLILSFPSPVRKVFNIVTRLMGIGLFSVLGLSLIMLALDLRRTGEVSLTLQLPFYPIAFALGLASILQCLVLVGQIMMVIGGKYDE